MYICSATPFPCITQRRSRARVVVLGAFLLLLAVPDALAQRVLYSVNPTLGQIERVQVGDLGLIANSEESLGIDLDAANEQVYWTDRTDGTIQRKALDGSGTATTILSGLSQPRAIDLDLTNGKVYWSQVGDNTIRRADLDGSNPEIVISSGANSPASIAVDIGAGKIYWTNNGGARIRRANLDGTGREDLVSVPSESVSALTLDLTNGKIYWSVPDEDVIRRAELDGSNVEDVVSANVETPRGLGLDLNAGKIYWAERDVNEIRRSNLDGTNVEPWLTIGLSEPEGLIVDTVTGSVLWTDPTFNTIYRRALSADVIEKQVIVTGLTTPYSVAIDTVASKVYWTDSGTDRIQRANLDGSTVEDVITTGLSVPRGIEIDVQEGKIYWSDTGTDQIQRADLDGSNVETLIDSGIDGAEDLALDPRADRLYWADFRVGSVGASDLDGGNRGSAGGDVSDSIYGVGVDSTTGIVYYGRVKSNGITNAGLGREEVGFPRDIVIDSGRGKLYWSDDGRKQVKRANLDGTQVEVLVSESGQNFRGIAVVAGTVPTVSRFNLTSLTPSDGSEVFGSTPVTATFDATITLDQATITNGNVLVSGNLTGRRAGTFTFPSPNQFVFAPTTNFLPGETIAVTISDDIRGTNGEIPFLDYRQSFTVKPVASPGTFSAQKVIASDADGAQDVFAADLDGDGDLDVLSASRDDATIAWYENDGLGNFGAKQVLTTEALSANSVFATDVDQDGDIDVLSLSAGDDVLALYEGRGDGTFEARVSLNNSASLINPRALRSFRTTGDGGQSLVFVAEGTQSNNGGLGSYSFASQVPRPIISVSSSSVPLDRPHDIRTADIDGDGILDYVSASYADNRVAWYSGAENRVQRNIATDAGKVRTIFPIDLDGDGDQDVLSASPFDDAIVWYENDGGATPSFTKQIISTNANGAWAVYAADLDGDGDFDVLSASTDDNKVALYQNDGAADPTFTETVITTDANRGRGLYVADLDGDGDFDVLSASEGDGKIAWYENTQGPQSDLRLTGLQGWRLLAAPDPAATLGDLVGDLWTQGFPGADATDGGASVLRYDESIAGDASFGWTAPTNQTEATGTRGYAVYVFDDQDFDGTPEGFPLTLDIGAAQASGTVTPGLSFTDNGAVASDAGWNLLGNPFAEPVDWDLMTKSALDATVYVWDPSSNTYRVWDGSAGSLPGGVIAPFQGFFVRAQSGAASLEIPEAAKTSGGAFYGAKPTTAPSTDAAIPTVALSLTTPVGEASAWVRLRDDAEAEADAHDAFALSPLAATYAQLFTHAPSGDALVINALPLLQAGESVDVPLNLTVLENGEAIDGAFALRWPSLEAIPAAWSVLLHDAETALTVDLRTESSYGFTWSSIGSRDDADVTVFNSQIARRANSRRFTLRITAASGTGTELPIGLPEALTLEPGFPNPFGTSTTIQFGLSETGPVRLAVYDVTGRRVRVLADEAHPAGWHEVRLDARGLASGIYLVRLTSSEGTATQRLSLVR